MTQKFTIRHPSQLARAHAVLDNLDPSKPWDFEVKLYKRCISDEQRKAYWSLINECIAGGVFSGFPNDFHKWLKSEFLIPILNEHDEEWKKDVLMCKELADAGKRDLALEHYGRLKTRISIMDLNVKLMGLYMDSVEGFTSQWGFMIKTKQEIKGI